MDDLENVILKIIGISEMLDKTKEKLMEYEEAIKNLYYKDIQFRDLTTKEKVTLKFVEAFKKSQLSISIENFNKIVESTGMKRNALDWLLYYGYLSKTDTGIRPCDEKRYPGFFEVIKIKITNEKGKITTYYKTKITIEGAIYFLNEIENTDLKGEWNGK